VNLRLVKHSDGTREECVRSSEPPFFFKGGDIYTKQVFKVQGDQRRGRGSGLGLRECAGQVTGPPDHGEGNSLFHKQTSVFDPHKG